METVSLYQAKSRLSELVREAEAGKEVIITKHCKPSVRIVPYERDTRDREFGFFAKGSNIASDFDETPEDLREYT